MWSEASTEALMLSVKVSLVAVVAISLVGTPLARWLARRRRPAIRLLESVVSLPLVIPPVVTGYCLLMALSPKSPVGRWLTGVGVRFALDWKGAVLASGVVAFPLFLAVAKTAFQRCDTRLEEAARMLKAGSLRVFFTVTLPIALPGILAAASLTFARAFGEFGATMMLAGNIPGQTRTVPQAIYTYYLERGGQQAAWGLVLVSVAIGMAAMIAAQCLAKPAAPRKTQDHCHAGI